MNTTLLKMECLTDLHVDSGESNYNIIDNEVQKDLNLSLIHISEPTRPY